MQDVEVRQADIANLSEGLEKLRINSCDQVASFEEKGSSGVAINFALVGQMIPAIRTSEQLRETERLVSSLLEKFLTGIAANEETIAASGARKEKLQQQLAEDLKARGLPVA